MNGRAIGSVVALLLVLGALNVYYWPDFSIRWQRTSLGTGPHGYLAVYELLVALDLPVERSFDAPGAVDPQRPLWFLEPDFLAPGHDFAESARSELLQWVSAGGTAIVFGGVAARWDGWAVELAESTPEPVSKTSHTPSSLVETM